MKRIPRNTRNEHEMKERNFDDKRLSFMEEKNQNVSAAKKKNIIFSA